MVMEVEVVRPVTSEDPTTVNLVSSFTPQSADIDFQPGPDYRGGRRVITVIIIATFPLPLPFFSNHFCKDEKHLCFLEG